MGNTGGTRGREHGDSQPVYQCATIVNSKRRCGFRSALQPIPLQNHDQTGLTLSDECGAGWPGLQRCCRRRLPPWIVALNLARPGPKRVRAKTPKTRAMRRDTICGLSSAKNVGLPARDLRRGFSWQERRIRWRGEARTLKDIEGTDIEGTDEVTTIRRTLRLFGMVVILSALSMRNVQQSQDWHPGVTLGDSK
jgi:hypothetical protein